MPRATIAIALLGLTLLAGCSTTALVKHDAAREIADRARLARVERAVARLEVVATLPGRLDPALSARRPGLGAWSWPDGRVRVGAALVDLLDDDELAAAIAHEVGHLVDHRHLPRSRAAAALAGLERDLGIERRADVIGCDLLSAAGLPADAMPRMLRKVSAALAAGDGSADDAPDPAVIARRADAAERDCAPQP